MYIVWILFQTSLFHETRFPQFSQQLICHTDNNGKDDLFFNFLLCIALFAIFTRKRRRWKRAKSDSYKIVTWNGREYCYGDNREEIVAPVFFAGMHGCVFPGCFTNRKAGAVKSLRCARWFRQRRGNVTACRVRVCECASFVGRASIKVWYISIYVNRKYIFYTTHNWCAPPVVFPSFPHREWCRNSLFNPNRFVRCILYSLFIDI